MGRILKYCLFLSNTKSISPKLLERDFFKFKEELPEVIKSEDKRSDLQLTAKTIHVKTKEIESTPVQQDLLEKMGFKYSDKTFDDLFVHGWKNAGAAGESLSSESEESEAEDVRAEAEEEKVAVVEEETKEIVQESHSEIEKIE